MHINKQEVVNNNLLEAIQRRCPALATLDDQYLTALSRRKCQDSEISDITAVLFHRMQEGEEITKLADKFLNICIKKKISAPALIEFDAIVHTEEKKFKLKSTQDDFKRWQRWGFDPEIFTQYNSFARFLLSSPLGNQMKIFHNTIPMQDGDVPGILVEGEWMSHEDVMDTFEVKYLPAFREKFMVHKETQKVYTYLDNGRGLQLHNPYTETTLNCPITRLTEEEFDRVSALAQTFVRPGEEHLSEEERAERNADRPFIYQIVSSYIDKGPKTNLTEICYRMKHPWVRIICAYDNPAYGIKKGDVFELGYNWDKPEKLPNATFDGRFRTEDFWNYKQADERVITNIPVSQEEVDSMLVYGLGYHTGNLEPTDKKEKIAFNLATQNCSAFVHFNSRVLGIKVPTKIYLTDLLKEVSPNWLKAIGRGYVAGKNGVVSGARKLTAWMPNVITHPISATIYKTKKIIKAIFSFLATGPVALISFLLGGAKGEAGRAFNKDLTKSEYHKPRLKTHKNFFSLKRFYYHMPGVLQKWQREQASTVIYKDTSKFCVVPPIVDLAI